MLMDLKTCQWDEKCLEFFDLPAGMLPKIVSSSENYGECVQGELKGVPMTCVLGDQQAAMLGQLCVRKGLAKNTYGTGCFMLMNTGDEAVLSTKGLLTTVLWQLGKDKKVQYALEGSIAVAGKAVAWLAENLGIGKDAREISALAESVSTSGGVYVIPAFTGLFAPYWKPDARGTFWGLTLSSTKAHIARATLEAICFQTAEVLDAMRQDAGLKLATLKVDGGMTKSAFTMQFQSDVLQVPVERPEMAETTVLGAAIGACLAVGYWDSLNEAETMISKETEKSIFKPTASAKDAEAMFDGWKSIVAKSFAPVRQDSDDSKSTER